MTLYRHVKTTDVGEGVENFFAPYVSFCTTGRAYFYVCRTCIRMAGWAADIVI